MTPFEQYMDLFRELGRLIQIGEGDSASADTLRDKMDPLWNCLTEEEIRRIDEEASH